MRTYFRSAEFWQCVVFLTWALFELTILSLHIASVGQTGLGISIFFLPATAFFLIKAFVSVVRWRTQNPEGRTSPVALAFLYSTGTLALALQTVWIVFHNK
jgi:hypothetical protein